MKIIIIKKIIIYQFSGSFKGQCSSPDRSYIDLTTSPTRKSARLATEETPGSPSKFEDNVEKTTEWFDQQSDEDQTRFVGMLLSRMNFHQRFLFYFNSFLKFCSPKDIAESQNKKLKEEVQKLKKDLDEAKSLQTKAEDEKLKLERYIAYKKGKKRSS